MNNIRDNGFGIRNVYPDPVTTEMNFELNSIVNGSVNHIISDLAGREVFSQHVRTISCSKSVNMSVEGLAAEVYNLQASSGTSTAVVQFVKN